MTAAASLPAGAGLCPAPGPATWPGRLWGGGRAAARGAGRLAVGGARAGPPRGWEAGPGARARCHAPGTPPPPLRPGCPPPALPRGNTPPPRPEELPLTSFLEDVRHVTDYRRWYFGHLHTDQELWWRGQAAVFDALRELDSGKVVRQWSRYEG